MNNPLQLDAFADAGIIVSVELVNALGRGVADEETTLRQTLARILADDPPSVARLRRTDVAGFIALAQRLQLVFAHVDATEVDAAAGELNQLLAAHPAHPHLAREVDGWRLHHHPVDAALVPMWTAICAEGLARLVGSDHADRLGTCARDSCGRVFVDLSRNASRRFCSTTCQNRVKTAAFRRRRAGDPG